MPTILSVLIAVLLLLCSSYLLRRQTSSQKARSGAGHIRLRVRGAGSVIHGQPLLADDWIAPILICIVTLALVLSLVLFLLSPAE